jgi:DNA-binding response OmpR family regulator
MRILVVEDEPQLAHAIARGLRQHGMAVDIALDGHDALEKAWINPYDVVVLDRDLPRLHGDDVCRKLIDTKSPPKVLMLTASGSLDDRIEGLSIGADDYLPKPFAMGELSARIHALSRRGDHVNAPVLTYRDLRLEPARRLASRGARQLQLTPKEFGILEVLMAADGTVVSAEQLLDQVWDEHTNPFTNTIRVTVLTLRRKLGGPPVIETVTGSGYRLA